MSSVDMSMGEGCRYGARLAVSALFVCSWRDLHAPMTSLPGPGGAGCYMSCCLPALPHHSIPFRASPWTTASPWNPASPSEPPLGPQHPLGIQYPLQSLPLDLPLDLPPQSAITKLPLDLPLDPLGPPPKCNHNTHAYAFHAASVQGSSLGRMASSISAEIISGCV